ncbi:hypothetical protein SPIRO4BDMA_40716 [uncultured spirochete]|uniref:Uncharacterized protein n=1 Tax=uncultured spirochete TaxID=156406 RepID=A0A3P3XPG9_9SPIR|nr:hypothetical protein SPIRO4BDMA_40716 [uncultured spirochete]
MRHLRTVSTKPEQMQSQFQKQQTFEIGSIYLDMVTIFDYCSEGYGKILRFVLST